jgi:norsolorinic acid ketoreductase
MTIYLITGASRGKHHIMCILPNSSSDFPIGLGRALTEAFIAKPGNVVIAAVRDPSQDTSQALCKLPSGEGSEMILVKIDSTSDTDAANAAKVLVTKHNIQRIDVVVANAGFGETWGDLSEVKPEEVRDLVDINALGKLCISMHLREPRSWLLTGVFGVTHTPLVADTACRTAPAVAGIPCTA